MVSTKAAFSQHNIGLSRHGIDLVSRIRCNIKIYLEDGRLRKFIESQTPGAFFTHADTVAKKLHLCILQASHFSYLHTYSQEKHL